MKIPTSKWVAGASLIVASALFAACGTGEGSPRASSSPTVTIPPAAKAYLAWYTTNAQALARGEYKLQADYDTVISSIRQWQKASAAASAAIGNPMDATSATQGDAQLQQQIDDLGKVATNGAKLGADVTELSTIPPSPDKQFAALLEQEAQDFQQVALNLAAGDPASINTAEAEMVPALQASKALTARQLQINAEWGRYLSPGTAAAVPGSATPTARQPSQRIQFTATEGTIATVADSANLRGTSVGFRTFIAKVFTQTQSPICAQTQTTPVSVSDYDSRGFAFGGVGCGGGAAAVWAVVNGSWTEIASTQNGWDCGLLAKFRVPSWLLGASNQCASGGNYNHG